MPLARSIQSIKGAPYAVLPLELLALIFDKVFQMMEFYEILVLREVSKEWRFIIDVWRTRGGVVFQKNAHLKKPKSGFARALSDTPIPGFAYVLRKLTAPGKSSKDRALSCSFLKDVRNEEGTAEWALYVISQTHLILIGILDFATEDLDEDQIKQARALKMAMWIDNFDLPEQHVERLRLAFPDLCMWLYAQLIFYISRQGMLHEDQNNGMWRPIADALPADVNKAIYASILKTSGDIPTTFNFDQD